jgi:hypothetical protein
MATIRTGNKVALLAADVQLGVMRDIAMTWLGYLGHKNATAAVANVVLAAPGGVH